MGHQAAGTAKQTETRYLAQKLIQGLGGRLLDGVPVNDPFGGWVYWSRIPLESIEQIEILRGGGSNVWGNYALGGVINIATRQVTDDRLAASVEVGNQNDLLVDISVVGEASGSDGRSRVGTFRPMATRSFVKISAVRSTSRHSQSTPT